MNYVSKTTALLFIFLLGFSGILHCKETREKLYFITTKTGLIYVRNQAGKVIIEPQKVSQIFPDHKKLIEGETIFLANSAGKNQEPHSIGSVYNRRGEYLFAPYMYDNGPDYTAEGLMRYVKNGKVGFASARTGAVVINAQYDFATPFNYGIAQFCNGCTYKKDGEYGSFSGGKLGYINIKGELLPVLSTSTNIKDQKVDGGYVGYPFSYSDVEQKLIAQLSRQTEISKAYFVNHVSDLSAAEKILHFEIVERPTEVFPYYQVVAFQFSKAIGYSADRLAGLHFLISKNGSQYFHIDFFDKKTPLEKWLPSHIKAAKAFSKARPDAPNKY